VTTQPKQLQCIVLTRIFAHVSFVNFWINEIMKLKV